jgi:hypothetical protein
MNKNILEKIQERLDQMKTKDLQEMRNDLEL